MTAWEQSNHGQRKQLLDLLVDQLHAIPEEVAQALEVKDPEVVGFYDRLCNLFNRE